MSRTDVKTTSAGLSALRRIIGRTDARHEDGPDCQLCSAPVTEPHRHMLDEQTGELLCACRACAVLFEREGAGRGHYRLVPDRRLRLPAVSIADLGIPVGVAFFTVAIDGSICAHYPSPMGATTWDVNAENWQTVLQECPALQDMAPEVEAFLVNTARDAHEYWLVPLDDCYRLIAIIRQEWHGLSGGGTVWPAVDRFFAELAENTQRRCNAQ